MLNCHTQLVKVSFDEICDITATVLTAVVCEFYKYKEERGTPKKKRRPKGTADGRE